MEGTQKKISSVKDLKNKDKSHTDIAGFISGVICPVRPERVAFMLKLCPLFPSSCWKCLLRFQDQYPQMWSSQYLENFECEDFVDKNKIYTLLW